jgi:hypothetical protein
MTKETERANVAVDGDQAAKQVSVLSGLASILIPCVGQVEYTRLCVPSILRHTREPYELIFIDIGSLDGTALYLAGVQDAAKVREKGDGIHLCAAPAGRSTQMSPVPFFPRRWWDRSSSWSGSARLR